MPNPYGVKPDDAYLGLSACACIFGVVLVSLILLLEAMR